MVLSSLPDEQLMRVMERSRGQGRNDYPVRSVWNSILAGVVFQHPSLESLRRELQRNGELRERCGFNPLLDADAVPPARVYTRFLRKLIRHLDHLEALFETLVEQLQEVLPDLGQHLAGDSKALPSAGKPTTKDPDGRRETDADQGKKEYQGTRPDGALRTKITSWFGFKLHLSVDARHELPLAYRVTRASAADTTEIRPLMASLSQKHEQLVRRSKYMFLDRGSDSTENNRMLYETYGIIPLSDIRHDCLKTRENDLI